MESESLGSRLQWLRLLHNDLRLLNDELSKHRSQHGRTGLCRQEKSPKTKLNVASCWRLETMVHLDTLNELQLSWFEGEAAACVNHSRLGLQKVAECQVCDFVSSKCATSVVKKKNPSGRLVDKVGLINKRQTAQICQCCCRDPGKHNCKLLSARWIMQNNSGVTQFDSKWELVLSALPLKSFYSTKPKGCFGKKRRKALKLPPALDSGLILLMITPSRLPWSLGWLLGKS